MIRHVFFGGGKRDGRRGVRRRSECSVATHRQAPPISPLAISMIEPSGRTTLMTLAGGTTLAGARTAATSGTAIALPTITGTTQKKACATVPRTTKALPEGDIGVWHPHHAVSGNRGQWRRAMALSHPAFFRCAGPLRSAAQNQTPVASTTGVAYFARRTAKKKLPCACGDENAPAAMLLSLRLFTGRVEHDTCQFSYAFQCSITRSTVTSPQTNPEEIR